MQLLGTGENAYLVEFQELCSTQQYIEETRFAYVYTT